MMRGKLRIIENQIYPKRGIIENTYTPFGVYRFFNIPRLGYIVFCIYPVLNYYFMCIYIFYRKKNIPRLGYIFMNRKKIYPVWGIFLTIEKKYTPNGV